MIYPCKRFVIAHPMLTMYVSGHLMIALPLINGLSAVYVREQIRAGEIAASQPASEFIEAWYRFNEAPVMLIPSIVSVLTGFALIAAMIGLGVWRSRLYG